MNTPTPLARLAFMAGAITRGTGTPVKVRPATGHTINGQPPAQPMYLVAVDSSLIGPYPYTQAVEVLRGVELSARALAVAS